MPRRAIALVIDLLGEIGEGVVLFERDDAHGRRSSGKILGCMEIAAARQPRGWPNLGRLACTSQGVQATRAKQLFQLLTEDCGELVEARTRWMQFVCHRRPAAAAFPGR